MLLIQALGSLCQHPPIQQSSNAGGFPAFCVQQVKPTAAFYTQKPPTLLLIFFSLLP